MQLNTQNIHGKQLFTVEEQPFFLLRSELIRCHKFSLFPPMPIAITVGFLSSSAEYFEEL